jgi:ComF family protein
MSELRIKSLYAKRSPSLEQEMNFFKEHLCYLCLQPCALSQGFCELCTQDFMCASQYSCCLQCGVLTPEGSERCGKCLSQPPAFDYSTHLYGYDPQTRFLLKRFKYYHKLNILDWLSPAMAQAILNHPLRASLTLPQYLVPVPLHSWRLIRRGFNQSTFIARHLSKTLNIPLLLGKVKRIRPTPQQAKLSMKERQYNMEQAFAIPASAPQLDHVAIVDDLMTTGATANALAKLLKQKCQTKIVEVWTLMRAM